MKNTVLGALIASAALFAMPASAQIVTGTINITGTVAPKCQVVFPGPASSTFSSTVDLGDLSQANGILRTDLSTAFNSGGTATANLDFQIVCTTAAPVVTVDSDPITTVATVDTGYANRIDYEATAGITLVNGSQDVSNDSAAAATTTSLTGRLVTGQTNFTVTADNFRTAAATDVLVAGSYTGVINITVAPTI